MDKAESASGTYINFNCPCHKYFLIYKHSVLYIEKAYTENYEIILNHIKNQSRFYCRLDINNLDMNNITRNSHAPLFITGAFSFSNLNDLEKKIEIFEIFQ